MVTLSAIRPQEGELRQAQALQCLVRAHLLITPEGHILCQGLPKLSPVVCAAQNSLWHDSFHHAASISFALAI